MFWNKKDKPVTKITHEVPGASAPIPSAAPPEFARGSVLRSVLRSGLPSTFGFLAVNLYDLADMFWVSRLGAQYIAAIALFEGFYWVLISTNDVAGLGSIAVISRRYGEGKIAHAATAIKESFLLKWLCALFSGLIGLIFLRQLMILMGARGEVIELGVQYGRVHMIALSLHFCVYSVFTSLRSIDAPRLAMWMMILGAALNMALDPFLIFGIGPFPELGIAGAALASVVSHGIVLLIGLTLYFSGRTPVRLKWRGEVPVKLSTMLNMMKIGLPGGVNTVSFSLARAVVTPLVAVFGSDVVAAYGIAGRVTLIGIFLSFGLGIGVSPLVGNLLGAGLKERAKRTSVQVQLLCLALMAALGLVLFAFATPIITIFFQEEPLVSIGVELLRIWALGQPFIGLWIVGESVFHGSGDNIPPMIVSLAASWLVEIPLILFVIYGLGMDQTAVWWARMFYFVAGGMTTFLWLRRGRWLEKKV